jgi:hypothetical protein
MASEIIQLDAADFSAQSYQITDTNLIPSFEVNTSLSDTSNIEFFIYDNNKNILYTEYNFKSYSVLNDGQSSGNNTLSQITFNPESDLSNLGFNQGEFITYYNFSNRKIGSNIELLYIAELSSDRTEIRLDSTSLTDTDIVEKTTTFINERESSSYFLDFYLNFGDNQFSIANNILLDNEDPTNPTILIKLYEPLPESYDVNSQLWVNTIIEEPVVYKVSFEEEPIVFIDTVNVKGPNFNLNIKDQVNNSTVELSYIDLLSSPVSSSHSQLSSLLEEKEIDINIDYTDFKNFIHFSSAKTRLENFYAKIDLIEQYESAISILDGTTSSQTEISSSKASYTSKINDIITHFDGYEYFLYYTPGSRAWPKSTTTQPYQLFPISSTEVEEWFGSTNEYSTLYGGEILSASLYDTNNPDNLYYSIPEYLREDPANQPYDLFVNMVGQHYDNIWIYYNEVTQKYNSDNRLEQGISKDLVADAIRDFGVKLYQNNFSNEDLYTAFLGLTPHGSLFPFPNITGSFPTPTGFEYVDTLVSASNDNMALDDVNKSLYKRIYHNLPYLLKSKGTLPGLRALITSYGIPDTMLRITEYGGKDKVNTNDWDYWQNEFNYAFSTSGSNFISSSWDLNSDWNSEDDVPSTLMFRFKTEGLPHTNIPYSQSVWYGDGGSAITLTYNGTAYASGSYSGSIIDPQYQYATLTLYPDTSNNTSTANVTLPFFDGEWWSVMVTRNGDDFTLQAQNKLLGGGDNSDIVGFVATSSINTPGHNWTFSDISYFPAAFTVSGPTGYDVISYDVGIYDGTGALAGTYSPFSGSYQEIRYYSNVVNNEAFDNYTMNPYSIEGNTLNDSPETLAFRAPVGGELYMLTSSIHPKVAGTWETTHSFANHSYFYFDTTPHFVPNTEYFYFNQPVVGIKNAISDKIRVENNVLPSGDTLSPFASLMQQSNASSSYTPNINYLEVAFSPQNELNDDIISQLGYFNIGEYIGDPSYRSNPNKTYPDLDTLRNKFFTKYVSNYNLGDFIRLIKFFDNSLFKMIRDFVPARTSLASGIVIKQHLLERNRYSQPQLTYTNVEISGSVKPQWDNYNENKIYDVNAGTGGVINQNLYPFQSRTEVVQTLSGSVNKIYVDQSEFYNGELPGAHIIASTQSLSTPFPGGDISSFANNEFNPLLNNVEDYRLSNIYEDVDYSNGGLTPINFDLITSSLAYKAPVQDSNYTTVRHSNPRYNGVKNTSERTNKWTDSPLNEGTLGKTPSVDHLKTAVAYCDGMAGWTPEYMDASWARIKYLINADGTVSIPDSTPNSLQNVQGTFMTGERVYVGARSENVGETTSIGSDNNKPYREVIRGGTRIENILYNQIGHTPPRWSGSIELYNAILPAVGNYKSTTYLTYSNDPDGNFYPPFDTLSPPLFPLYTVPQGALDDNVILQVTASLYMSRLTTGGDITDGDMGIYLRNYTTNTTIKLQTRSNFTTDAGTITFTLNYEIPISSLDSLVGDQLEIKYYRTPQFDPLDPKDYRISGGQLTINQYPTTGEQPSVIVPSDIWQHSAPTLSIFATHSMFTTQPFMIDAYDINQINPTWYMKDIDNSGFNPIFTEWDVDRGDVFRFEGDQEKAYIIDSIERLDFSGIPMLIVNFAPDVDLTNININRYSLTRYVDDASQIILKGFRPYNASAPYILKPEFVVPELDKDIDTFIVELTQKGLL